MPKSPIHPVQGSLPLAHSDIVPRKGQTRRVLVVDDQPDVADALGALLRSLGHSVSVAYDATHALDLFRRERPEVAILDLTMPEISGYELARRLRADSTELRLLALSGSAEVSRSGGEHPAGFERVLIKPPDVDALIRSLDG